MMQKNLLPVAFFLGFLGIAAPVQSATVSFDFTATVTSVNTFELTSSGGLIGQSGTGRVSYDLNPDYFSNFPAAGAAVYGFDVPDAEFTFELAGMVFEAGAIPTVPISAANADVSVDIRNDSASGDLQIYWGQGVSQTLEGFGTRMALVLRDTTNTAVTDFLLPDTPPVLSLFEAALSSFQIQISTAPGTHTGGLRLSIDSITASVVPVPAAAWLFGTVLIGLVGFNKRKKAI